jgi:hypothetical protein
MANMFRTIEQQGGSSGPEWLSDHPNPGNRSAYITKEAQALRVTNPVHDTAGFERVRAHLRGLPKAPTTEEVTRTAKRGEPGESRPPTGQVAAPSSRYTQYTEGDVFRVSVPSNWRELPGGSAVTFAPDGAYGALNGQSVFTHGVEIGLARNESNTLQGATDALIESLVRGNPQLRRRGGYQRTSIGGRTGLQTTLSNVSELTRQAETIRLVTALLDNGTLLYAVAVAPEREYPAYQAHFQRVVGSIRLIG